MRWPRRPRGPARCCFAPRRGSGGWSSAMILAAEVDTALRDLGARRAIVVSEPGAGVLVDRGSPATSRVSGWPVERVMLPQGEDAKRLSIVETAASELAGLRVERREPLIAVGGGALGDTAGFVAATVTSAACPSSRSRRPSSPSSIRRSARQDRRRPAEGKNLVGAFHQPAAIVADISVLASLTCDSGARPSPRPSIWLRSATSGCSWPSRRRDWRSPPA